MTWPGHSQCNLAVDAHPQGLWARSPAWAACAIGIRDSWGFAVIIHMLPEEIPCSCSFLGGPRGGAWTPSTAPLLHLEPVPGSRQTEPCHDAVGICPLHGPRVGLDGGMGGRGTSCWAGTDCEGTARMEAYSSLPAIRTWGHLPMAALAVVACWGWARAPAPCLC